MDALKIIAQGSVKDETPKFNIGDTVRVYVKVVEGDKERLQAFEGIVIARSNTGLRENFTVRKISYGVGACIPASLT